MSALITTHGISKGFPGVKALDNVSFELRPGEVHALVGENGAGKSTLIKILMGVYQRDSGSYEIKGQSVSAFSPLAAKSAGLAAVYQDISLAPNLSVVRISSWEMCPRKDLGFLIGGWYIASAGICSKALVLISIRGYF